jgi:hypothetical protein
MVNIFSSMMAAIGKQLKQSVKVFHSLILYRRLPNRCTHVSRTKTTERINEQLTFVVKAVDTVDTCAFVVSSQNEEVFRVLDLVSEEETDGFERLFASIYIIS